MPADVRSDSVIADGDPQWFREPTPREHRIAAILFVGFGVFFAMLFVVLAGWWFRWVIMALALVSFLYGLSHATQMRGRRNDIDINSPGRKAGDRA